MGKSKNNSALNIIRVTWKKKTEEKKFLCHDNPKFKFKKN